MSGTTQMLWEQRRERRQQIIATLSDLEQTAAYLRDLFEREQIEEEELIRIEVIKAVSYSSSLLRDWEFEDEETW
jgi:DNA-binding protein H-NS